MTNQDNSVTVQNAEVTLEVTEDENNVSVNVTEQAVNITINETTISGEGGGGGIDNETDPIWESEKGSYYTKLEVNQLLSEISVEETDPIFTDSEAFGITSTDTSNWNTAYGWGDHSLAGYLTSSSIANFETTTQLNARDTANRDRDNHTGVQDITTINELPEALLAKQDVMAGSGSVLVDGSTISLENDEAFPGNDKVYGTNSSGIRGWYDMAEGGGGGGVTDHALLSNLGWASAGHTMDTLLDMSSNPISMANVGSYSTPAGGVVSLIAKDDAGTTKFYMLDSTGTETEWGSGGGGAVSSVFGRTGAVTAESGDYDWAKIDLTGSDLADIETKSHLDLDDIGTYGHDSIDSHIDDTSVHFTDTGFVHDTGDETINGVKTFGSLFFIPTTPTLDNHPASKGYVDAFSLGLAIKTACRVATTTNITLSNLQTIDGVLLIAGDRVLVKNQTNQTQNGIYVASSGAWARAADFDDNIEVRAGSYTFIFDGTAQELGGNKFKSFAQITIDPILGSDNLVFTQVSSPASYGATNGLNLTSGQFGLGGSLTGSTTITQGNFNYAHNLSGTGSFTLQVGGNSRFQLNSSGLMGIGAGAIANTTLYIKPNSDTHQGINIRANSPSQSSRLLNWQNSAGGTLGYISGTGHMAIVHTNTLQPTANSLTLTQTGQSFLSQLLTTNNEDLDTAYEGFKFTVGASNIALRMVALQMKTTAALTNPTHYYYLEIRADSSGNPGTLIRTSSTVRFGELTTASVVRTFTMLSTTLSASTSYWCIIRRSAAPAGGTVSISMSNATGTNTYTESANGTSWTAKNGTPYFVLTGGTGQGVRVSTDQNNAVMAYSKSAYGGYFDSYNSVGAYGNSINGVGVYGNSLYSNGGRFVSLYGTGLYVSTGSGIGADAVSTSGTAFRATTTTGIGALFNTTSGTGFQAMTTTGLAGNVVATPASADSYIEVFRINRRTSETPATGMGGFYSILLGSTHTANNRAGSLGAVWTDQANRHADLVFGAMRSGVAVEAGRFTSEKVLNINGGLLRYASSKMQYSNDSGSNWSDIGSGGEGGGYTNLTSFTSQTPYTLFYANGDGDVTELAFGDSGKVLTSNGASLAPTWETSGEGHAEFALDTDAQVLFSLTTQTMGVNTQTANYVWAGPTSGGAYTPTFRLLDAADIPDLSNTYLTSVAFTDLTDYPANAAGALTNDGSGNLSWSAGGAGDVIAGTQSVGYVVVWSDTNTISEGYSVSTSVTAETTTALVTEAAVYNALLDKANATDIVDEAYGGFGTDVSGWTSGYIPFRDTDNFATDGGLFWDNTSKHLETDVLIGVTGAGVKLTQTAGVLSLTGLGNAYNRAFTVDTDQASSKILLSTGADLIEFGKPIVAPVGTTAAGTASIYLPTSDLMTSPESGAIENDGTNLYYTNSSAEREEILTAENTPTARTTVVRKSLVEVNGDVLTTTATYAGVRMVGAGTLTDWGLDAIDGPTPTSGSIEVTVYVNGTSTSTEPAISTGTNATGTFGTAITYADGDVITFVITTVTDMVAVEVTLWG
jgi:hypothetical protein